MRAYIPIHNSGAGKWIYKGYAKAWSALGYEVHFFSGISEIKDDGEYYVMCIDAQVDNENFHILENSTATFVYTQPNVFPLPWRNHPNFQCHCRPDVIKKINKLGKAKTWTFGHSTRFHSLWKKPLTVPLAFDDESYKDNQPKEDIDVCFIGGAANNGFDTKMGIMSKTLEEFKDSGLKCAFHVNESISHERESQILFSSKVALNIHDEYQRVLGLDTNERTFKSLGCCGLLVSDEIDCLDSLFNGLPQTNDPQKMVKIIKESLASFSADKLSEMKERTKSLVLKSHTYKNRVKALLNEQAT